MPIRHACLEDAAAIARVHVHSWRTTYTGILPDVCLRENTIKQREEQWRHHLSDPRHQAFTAVALDRAGRVIGFANVGRQHSEWPRYEGELLAIYVLKNHQCRGHGRRLVRVLAEALLAQGIESMVVWALKDNPGCGFYENLGGRLCAEQPLFIEEVCLAEVAYGWADIRQLLVG